MHERKSHTYFRTEGIVLFSEKMNEADISATILTPHRGKLKGLLKSARRSKNRFRGNLETGGVVRMMMYFRAQSHSHGRITDISVVEPLPGIRTDLKRILVMNYVLDAVNAVIPFDDAEPALYALLRDTLVLMEASDDMRRTADILRIFEVKLLVLMGIHPDLEHCASCGCRIPGKGYFSFSGLETLCSVCRTPGHSVKGLVLLEPEFLAFYHDCLGKSMTEILGHPIASGAEKQSRLFFRRIFMDYLGKSLNVPRIAQGLV